MPAGPPILIGSDTDVFNTSGSLTIAVPGGQSVPAGDTVFVDILGVEPNTPTVTDDGGNTYAQVQNPIAGGLYRSFVTTPLAETEQITISFSGLGSSSRWIATAFHVPGLADAAAEGAAGPEHPWDPPTTAIAATEDGILIGRVQSFSSGENLQDDLVEDPDFTTLYTLATPDFTNPIRQIHVAHRIVPSDGNFTYDPSGFAVSANAQICVISYGAAPAGAGALPLLSQYYG